MLCFPRIRCPCRFPFRIQNLQKNTCYYVHGTGSVYMWRFLRGQNKIAKNVKSSMNLRRNSLVLGVNGARLAGEFLLHPASPPRFTVCSQSIASTPHWSPPLAPHKACNCMTRSFDRVETIARENDSFRYMWKPRNWKLRRSLHSFVFTATLLRAFVGVRFWTLLLLIMLFTLKFT